VDDGLEDLPYDEATRRRIDGAPRRRVARRARPGAQFAGTVTLVTAIGLGLQQVFDPPADEEVVLEVDTSRPGGDDEPVTFDYDPTSVRRSRAHVRPWLLATIR
jgi:hypothetical protein